MQERVLDPKGPQRGPIGASKGCRSQRGPEGAPISKGSRRGPRRGPEGAPARTCGCRPAAAFEGVFKLQTNANFAVAGQIFYLLIISGPPRFFSAPLVEGGRSPRREPSVLLSVPLKKEQKTPHSLGTLCPKFWWLFKLSISPPEDIIRLILSNIFVPPDLY